MSLNLSADIEGWEDISRCLKSLGSGHDESARFLAAVFDQLELRLAEWGDEQKRWQSDRSSREIEFQRQAEELNQQREELTRQWERLQQERSTSESLFKGQTEEIQRQRAESAAQRKQIEELQRGTEPLAAQRAELELELDTVRNRAVEMAEELESQKQQATKQQERWAEEFQSQRRLLEKLVSVLTQGRFEPREAEGPGKFNGDAAVLGSLKAQFEKIQRERARRQ